MALALGLTGCLEDLPKPSNIVGLRVLAIQADRPEVAPGETVRLRALVVDSLNRPVTLHWFACVLPERSSGFFGGQQEAGFSGGGGYSAADVGTCTSVSVDTLGPSRFLGVGAEVELTIPADFLSPANVAVAYGLPADAQLPPEIVAGIATVAGVNMTVTLVATTGDATLEAFKRVNVSLAVPQNENPTDLAFRLALEESGVGPPPEGPVPPPSGGRCFVTPDGNPPAISEGRWWIDLLNVPEDPVDYPVILGGTGDNLFELVITEETYFYSFFSTHGVFQRDIIKSTGIPAVKWSLEGPFEGPVPIWIVVRDGRGGTSWCHDEMAVVSAPSP